MQTLAALSGSTMLNCWCGGAVQGGGQGAAWLPPSGSAAVLLGQGSPGA